MPFKWRTTIKSDYKKRCVFRATLGGGIGAAALLGSGAFMPAAELSFWGLPLFLVAGALIAWSMLPYRKAVQLENKPNEIWINSTGDLVYSEKGTPTLTVPQESIKKVFYFNKPSIYGICIVLQTPLFKKIRVHTSTFNFLSFQKKSLHTQGCDLFFPFFSERTRREIEDALWGNENDDKD